MAAADHVRDQPGPAGLMCGAEAGPVVAVEVLVEDEVVFPRRVVLQAVDPPEAGSPAVRADGEDGDQPVLQIGGDQVEGDLVARPGRVLDGQLVAEELVVAVQRADEQVVQREPDRPAPVGVPADMKMVDSAGS